MTELDPAATKEWADLNANVLNHDEFQTDFTRLFARDGGMIIGAYGEVLKVCQQFPVLFNPKQKVSWEKKGTKHQTAVKV